MMKKKEVIEAMACFVLSSDCSWKGQRPFVEFLMQYIAQNEMPGDKYDFIFISQYFHKIVLDAAIAFRMSNEPNAVALRAKFEEETGHEVPDVTGFGKHSCSFVQICMQFVAKKVFGDQGSYISSRIDALCNAHWHALDQVFRKFIHHVWRNGICELIEKSSERGLRGEFGDVTLLTYTIAGRTAIQFDKKDGASISYMAEEDDHTGYSAGINYCHTDLHTACNMIQTVIDNWSKNRAEQEKIFFSDKEVKHWAVAMMDAQKEQASV